MESSNYDYASSVKRSLEMKRAREERLKLVSKERLEKIAKKKIQTTMIGALSDFEKFFGFLLGPEDSEPTKEQKKFRGLFEELRSSILDRGNIQIRNMETEISHYDIVWKKNSIVLPFKGENK